MVDSINIKVPVAHKTYDFLCETKKRINLVYGGAGSAKSWQIGIFLLIEKFYSEKNIRILIARKTLPSLRKSCWLLITDLLKKFKLPYKENKTSLTISHGSNTIFFVSLDDVEKLKSIESINYVWIEEATETNQNDFLQLNLRCRGHNENGINQLYISFNPSDEMSFLKELTENPGDDMAVSHTTYVDNPFLGDEEKRQIDRLKDIDEAYHKIYGLGEWASLTGTIYSGWRACNEWPGKFDDTRYGLDFGYNNPTALIEINYLDAEVYLRELLYESNITNSELIERLPELVAREGLIIADCAEPDRIEEIYQANYDVHPCYKGGDSVRRGIDIVKSKTVWYHPDSENIRKEHNRYKWREDSKGNGLDEPVKIWDHAMDAIRYGISYGEASPTVIGFDDNKADQEPVMIAADNSEDDWEEWE